jgi:hypothetical protein
MSPIGRIPVPRAPLLAISSAALVTSLACAQSAARAPASDARAATESFTVAGAWRLLETASRAPGGSWESRPAPQGGLYVFSARHYSYFYIRTPGPRPRFADANRPTEAERAATFDTFIAGAGTYTFDGQTLDLGTEFRKNPNEMGMGGVWRWRLERVAGDTAVFMFTEPPFLPGGEWRTTLLRVE